MLYLCAKGLNIMDKAYIYIFIICVCLGSSNRFLRHVSLKYTYKVFSFFWGGGCAFLVCEKEISLRLTECRNCPNGCCSFWPTISNFQ